MKPYQRIKCRACGHFGHQPGSRCPLRNLVPDDRPAAKARVELAKLFPHRPDLVAALEAMQESWVPKMLERSGKSNPQSFNADVLAKPLQSQVQVLAERWGARVRA